MPHTPNSPVVESISLQELALNQRAVVLGMALAEMSKTMRLCCVCWKLFFYQIKW